MNIVLDTNVLVAGLLTPFAPSAEIVRMTVSGKLSLCYDARILSEYKEVLVRPKFNFNKEHIEALLDQITFDGHLVTGQPIFEALPDKDDEAFLEVALAGGVKYLVTWNVKHFPDKKGSAVKILSPEKFLSFLRKEDLSHGSA